MLLPSGRVLAASRPTRNVPVKLTPQDPVPVFEFCVGHHRRFADARRVDHIGNFTILAGGREGIPYFFFRRHIATEDTLGGDDVGRENGGAGLVQFTDDGGPDPSSSTGH